MSTTAVEPISPQAKRVAVAVVVGLIAPILDTTIVTIAFARLATALNTTVDTIQWTSTGYLLALAVAVPLAGWAAARFGSRAAWQTGVGLFLVGSILSALSWNVYALIAFRALQGLGAGLLFPLMTSILVACSDRQTLGRLMAMVTLPTALGPILGPVVGGLVLHWFDWPWLFVVNVPVCIAALWLSRRIPDNPEPQSEHAHLDAVGLLILTPGLLGVLLGLSNAHEGVVRAAVLVPLAIGVAFLAAFVSRSLRMGGRTLIDVSVLARRSVFSSSAGLLFFGIVSFGSMLVLPLYLQQIRGEAVLEAALVLIPQGVGALVSRAIAGRLSDQFGARWVAVVGFLIVAVATVPFALADSSTSMVWLMVALFVRGLGLGTLLSPIMAAAFVSLPDDERHDASMVTRTFQQIGGSFGTALNAVVLLAGTTAAVGFSNAFWTSVVVALIGAVFALTLPDRQE